MEMHGISFGLLGYLIVVFGGFTAIILSIRNKMNNGTAWTISGISLLMGIFIVSGDKITEITTPIGSIKTAVENAEAAAEKAKDIVKRMEELKLSIEETRNNAKLQTDDIKRINQESELIIKDLKASLADIQKIKKDTPILNKILFNKEAIKKEQRMLTIEGHSQETKKAIEEKIDILKNENNELRKQLTTLQDN